MLISKKVQFLKCDFNLNDDRLESVSCPILCVLRLMLRPVNIRSLTLFYIPIPNNIKKDTLQKINELFASVNLKPYCTFFSTTSTQSFSGKILNLTCTLYQKNLFISACKNDVLIGIISPECPLLNYFLLTAKLFIWDSRRSQILPILARFKIKIKINLKRKIYLHKEQNLKSIY